jgi:energy-coupling factor transport system substrate-specific component
VIDYLRASAGSRADLGSIERTILAARSAGVSARHFGGHDLIAALEGGIGGDGAVSDQVNLTAFAVLALRADGVPPPGRMLAWIARQQDSDGGFSFGTGGGASDVDDTGAALEALGGGSRAAGRAVRFIRSQQNSDGGFPSQPGADSNAQSTAWAIQGLIAAGVDPAGMRRGGRSPFDYLTALIRPDGHVAYSSSSDETPVWVTAEALMALERKTLPLPPVIPVAPRTAVAPVRVTPRRHRVIAPRAPVIVKHARAHHARRHAPPTEAPMLRLAARAGVLAALVLAPINAG